MRTATDHARHQLLEEVLRTGSLRLGAGDAATLRGRQIAELRDEGLICQILGDPEGRGHAVFIVTEGGLVAWRRHAARAERRLLRRRG